MAIKTEDLTKMEEFLKLEKGTLTTAHESDDEADIEFTPDLVIKTKDENETFILNLNKDSKTAGLEMAIKGARTDLGLDFQGKTMDNLLEAHKTKVLADAKDDLGAPDKKITELTNDLTKVRANLADRDTEILGLKTDMKTNTDNSFIDSQLLAMIPDNLTISKSDALTLLKSKHGIELAEDRSLTFKKDGAVMKNETTLEALGGKEVITAFSTPFLKKPGGGAGGETELGNAKAGSMEAFEKEMKDAGHNVGSQHFNTEMNKRITDKTLTV